MKVLTRSAITIAILIIAAVPSAAQLVGVVQDAGGRPPGSGDVLVIPVGASCTGKAPLEKVLIQGKLDKRGVFLIDLPPVVTMVDVRVQVPGMVPETIRSVATDGEPLNLILRPGATLSGFVDDEETGSPVGGVTARFLPSPANEESWDVFDRCARMHPDSVLVPSAVSNSEGNIRMEGLAPGYYEVRVEAPLHIDVQRPRYLVPPGGKDDLDVMLRPAAGLRGVVRDERGRALRGAVVRVGEPLEPGARRRGRGGPGRPEPQETETGRDGSWSLDDLPANRMLRVRAVAAGRVEAREDVEPMRPGEVREISFRLEPGVAVTGTVVDETGEPVSGAAVLLREPEEAMQMGMLDRMRQNRMMAFRGLPGDTPRTDSRGRFSLSGVAPGLWLPTVVASGLVRQPEGGPVEVDPESPEDMRIQVTLGPALRGTVIDETGAPVPEARVQARAGGAARMGGDFLQEITDEEGRFVLRTGEADSVAFLTASREGYGEAMLRDLLPGGEPVQVVLERAGGLEGQVLAADGAPVTVFKVRAVRREQQRRRGPWRGPEGAEEFYDEEGRFTLEDLAPGIYDITVETEGLAPGRVEDIEVVSDIVTPVGPVTLTEGLTLFGIVLEEGTDLPVAGATVGRSAGPRSDRSGGVETGIDGTFALEGVPPGVHTIAAVHPEFADASLRGVRVTAGEEPAPLTIRMERGGTVEGTVTSGGEPVSGARVEAVRGWGEAPSSTTDAAGRYMINALSPGRYTLTLLQPGKEPRWKSAEVRSGTATTVDFGDETPGTLTGTVRRSGEAVPDVTVILWPSARMLGSAARETVTGAEGDYRFEDLNPGAYMLMAMRGGASGTPGAPPVSVEVGEGAEVARDVDLPAIVVTGRVLDAATGEPVLNASVTTRVTDSDPLAPRMIGRGRSYGTSTDSTGGFSIEVLDPGAYQFTVRHAEYARLQETVQVPEDGRGGVVLEVSPAGTLRGRLLDETGNPLGGAIVMAQGMGSFSRTDEGGRFLLERLEDRAMTLRFAAAGVAPMTVANVRPSPEEQVWTLDTGGALVIRVDTDPASLQAGSLRLISPGGEDMTMFLTQSAGVTGVENKLRSSGYVRLPHLETGVWQVTFNAAGARATGTANVQKGTEAELTLQL